MKAIGSFMYRFAELESHIPCSRVIEKFKDWFAVMTYSEVADFDQHKKDVYALVAVARGLGIPTNGYQMVIDVGGGLGMHAPWLQEIASKVYITDIIKYTEIFDGHFVALINEKCIRNSVPYSIDRTEFHFGDAQSLIYKNQCFDAFFSVNAFEHIPDPTLAFMEMVRVTKPEALVMIQFDPIWSSPFGHHLWHLNLPPWIHLLKTDAEMHEIIRAYGGVDRDIEIYDLETNRQKTDVYFEMFETMGPEYFSVFGMDHWAKDETEESWSNHENFAACLQAGYKARDILTRGIRFVGKRR